MTKRAHGKYERRPGDWWPTPQAAIPVLGPHIPQGSRFIEPCAGDASLARMLQDQLNLRCVSAMDIAPKTYSVEMGNALFMTNETVKDADVIITNPPYERTQMHLIIDHCRRLKPSWFLLEADWLFTVQASELLTYADKIVAVGRLKWIPDSKSNGFDNFAWVRFGKQLTQSAPFFPRKKTDP